MAAIGMPVLPVKLAYVSPRLVRAQPPDNRACGRTVRFHPCRCHHRQVSAPFIGTDAFQEVDVLGCR